MTALGSVGRRLPARALAAAPLALVALLVLAGVLLVTPVAPAEAVPPSATSAADGRDPDVTVVLDRTRDRVAAGGDLRVHTVVRNRGSATLAHPVAFLNITSTDPDVYVDPEDWSPERTQYLRPLAAGESQTLAWHVRAVGAGRILLFVSLADQGSTGPVAGSPALRLTVTQETALSGRSALPVGLAVPAGVLAVWAGVGARRRRLG